MSTYEVRAEPTRINYITKKGEKWLNLSDLLTAFDQVKLALLESVVEQGLTGSDVTMVRNEVDLITSIQEMLRNL